MWLGLDLSDRIRDPASDSTLDSSTFDSEAESDYLEESDGNEKAETKCTKCGTWPNVVSRTGDVRDKRIDFNISFPRITDDLSKLLEVHNEVLALLKGKRKHLIILRRPANFISFLRFDSTEIKRDNDKIHKSLSLQMQMCRQEIIEHVRDLKNSVIRMVGHSTNGTHHKAHNGNDLLDDHDFMDDANDDVEFRRWQNAREKGEEQLANSFIFIRQTHVHFFWDEPKIVVKFRFSFRVKR